MVKKDAAQKTDTHKKGGKDIDDRVLRGGVSWESLMGFDLYKPLPILYPEYWAALVVCLSSMGSNYYWETKGPYGRAMYFIFAWFPMVPWIFVFIFKLRSEILGHRSFSGLCLFILFEWALWVWDCHAWTPEIMQFPTPNYRMHMIPLAVPVIAIIFRSFCAQTSRNAVSETSVLETSVLEVISANLTYTLVHVGSVHIRVCNGAAVFLGRLAMWGDYSYFVLMLTIKVFETTCIVFPVYLHTKVHNAANARKMGYIFRFWVGISIVFFRFGQMLIVFVCVKSSNPWSQVAQMLAINMFFDIVDRTFIMPNVTARIFRNDHIVRNAEDAAQRNRLYYQTFHLAPFILGMALTGTGASVLYEAKAYAMLGLYAGSVIVCEYIVIAFNQRRYKKQNQSMTMEETVARLTKYPLQHHSLDTIGSEEPTTEADSQPMSPGFIQIYSLAMGLAMFMCFEATVTLIMGPCGVTVSEETCATQNSGMMDLLFLRKCSCDKLCWDGHIV